MILYKQLHLQHGPGLIFMQNHSALIFAKAKAYGDFLIIYVRNQEIYPTVIRGVQVLKKTIKSLPY